MNAEDVLPRYARTLTRAVLSPLRRYYRFHTEGLQHVPRSGPVMVCMHHSFATYDAFLVGRDLLEHTGRLPEGLGDDNLFKVPGVRRLCTDLGIRPARPETGERILRQGGLLMLAPGGTREALRPRHQRYRPVWHDRFGFVRLSIRTGAPVVLGACPAADRIYTVYDSRLTRIAYERTRWPVPLVRGLGPTTLPRPVRLTGYLDVPRYPPDASPDDEAAVRAFHAELTEAMVDLLGRP